MYKNLEKLLFIISATLLLNSHSAYANELVEESDAQESYSLTDTSSYEENNQYKEEDIEQLIEEIKSTEKYINSEKSIRQLYNKSFDYALKLINIENVINDNSKYVYDNLKTDVSKIEEFAENPALVSENINTNSHFFISPNTKIAYLKLDKDQQDEIDSVKENKNRSYLTIKEMDSLEKYGKPIFFDDWLYRFMLDKDKDAMVGEFGDDIADFRNNNLNKKYRTLTPEERYQVNIFDKNNDGSIDEKELELAYSFPNTNISLLREFIINNTIDQPTEKDEVDTNEDDIEKIENDNDDEPIIQEDKPDTKTEDPNFDSIFYKNNTTRDPYSKLTDDQRDQLDAMNSNGDNALSIEEVIASGKFTFPIIENIDWIYPFMVDEDNDGIINTKQEDDGEYENDDTEENSNEQTKADIKDAIKLLESSKSSTIVDDSVFLKHELTRDAYLLLTDEQKEELNLMNKDGKYPLSIEEVISYGKYQIPIKKDIDWIYPFMVDEDNDGLIGKEADNSNDTKYSDEKNPSLNKAKNKIISQVIYSQPVKEQDPIVTNNRPVYNQSQATHHPTKPIAKQKSSKYVSPGSNVRTGIKGIKSLTLLTSLLLISYIKFKDQ